MTGGWGFLGAIVILSVACSADVQPNVGERLVHDSGTATMRAPVVAPACGVRPLSECPLQRWMRANAAPALAATDWDWLERAFERIERAAPADYPRWRDVAHRGAADARAHDLSGVRGVCKDCHDAYRADYRQTRRAAPLL